jgi:hypothetical protein
MSKQVYLVPSNVLCVFGRAKCRAMTLIRVLPLLPLFLALGCSGDDVLGAYPSEPDPPEESTDEQPERGIGVIGHLSGLIDSNEITLSLNNAESLPRTTNGDFTFINEVPADSTFGIVTVSLLPTNPSQECEVHMAESLPSSRTLNVEVRCACPRGYTQEGIGCITDTNPCNGTLDDCNVCDGDGSTCTGCDNIPNSGLVNDACGICNGDGSSCAPPPIYVPHPTPPGPAAGVVYVKADATGADDGSSWNDAYASLANALTAVGAPDQAVNIWVAQGVYRPTETGDREQSFVLQNDVVLLGGFVGSESSADERSPNVHPAILSGALDLHDPTKNCFHVVYADSVNATAILDGFVISDGQADGDQNKSGGGIYLYRSSPTLRNLKLVGNHAQERGGGMYNLRSLPTLTNVAFVRNRARLGGGMANAPAQYVGSDAVLVNVSFVANQTLPNNGAGAAMHNLGSSPLLTNVLFVHNATAGMGGAIINHTFSHPVLTNVTFAANAASRGGAMVNYKGSQPKVTNSIFWRNINHAPGDNNVIKNLVGTPHDPASFALVSYTALDAAQDGASNLLLTESPFVEEPSPGFDQEWGTDDDVVLELRQGLCIDAGNSSAVTTATDLLGNPRITGDLVDLGAYEAQ